MQPPRRTERAVNFSNTHCEKQGCSPAAPRGAAAHPGRHRVHIGFCAIRQGSISVSGAFTPLLREAVFGPAFTPGPMARRVANSAAQPPIPDDSRRNGSLKRKRRKMKPEAQAKEVTVHGDCPLGREGDRHIFRPEKCASLQPVNGYAKEEQPVAFACALGFHGALWDPDVAGRESSALCLPGPRSSPANRADTRRRRPGCVAVSSWLS